jgi:hypothetical protein
MGHRRRRRRVERIRGISLLLVIELVIRVWCNRISWVSIVVVSSLRLVGLFKLNISVVQLIDKDNGIPLGSGTWRR